MDFVAFTVLSSVTFGVDACRDKKKKNWQKSARFITKGYFFGFFAQFDRKMMERKVG